MNWKQRSMILACAALASCIDKSQGEAQPANDAVQLTAPKAEMVQKDCSGVGLDRRTSSFAFVPGCKAEARSPNGMWGVSMESKEPGSIHLMDRSGRIADDLFALADAMPFSVTWSPNSRWFFANHYQGSSLDRLRVFEVTNWLAVERSAIFSEATRVAAERHPCLRSATIHSTGWKWSKDGRRLAMAVYARPDACLVEVRPGQFQPKGEWNVLWMVGDVETGRIDPASVRIRENGTAPFPAGAPYHEF